MTIGLILLLGICATTGILVKGDLCRLLWRRRVHLTLVITMTIVEDLHHEALPPRRRRRLDRMIRVELLLQILVLMICDLLTSQGLLQCMVDLSMIDPRQYLVAAIMGRLRGLRSLLVVMIETQVPTAEMLLTATDGLELLQLLLMRELNSLLTWNTCFGTSFAGF